jgi:phage terminase small subunit
VCRVVTSKLAARRFFKGKTMENSEKKSETSKKSAEKAGLSPKRERFCQEYLIDLNGTQAAIRAGYSPKTANEQAARLLADVNIRSRVEQLMKERSARCQVKQDDVITELKRLGFSNMQDFSKWNGSSVTLEDSEKLNADQAACVESVSQTTSKDGGSISIKLHSKTKSLELIARHLGMLHDKHTVTYDDASIFAKRISQIILKYVPEDKIDECAKEISSIIAKANE